MENPYWQYFCGEIYFQHQAPLNPSSLTRWRQRLGEQGIELLLSATIDTAIESKAVRRRDLKRVTVDTTVQENTEFLYFGALVNKLVRLGEICRLAPDHRVC